MRPDSRILRVLRVAAMPIAASDLAASVELSRETLAERIEGLNAAGYQIELQPHLGYRLAGTPDRLIADDICARLGVNSPFDVLVFAETSSTNDVAMRMGRSGAPEGTVIFAECQTRGRGRLGRRWESAPHKGLWFSLLLRPNLPATDWSRLTTLVAVGVARGFEEVLPGCRAQIKWPNDVYLNGRKAAGILIESSLGSPQAPGFAVVGIGVNVNHDTTDFPDELADRAISLRQAAEPEAGPLDRQEVAAALLRNLDTLYRRIGSDFQSIVDEAAQRGILLGKRVRIEGTGEIFEGTAESLEPDGTLRVRRDDGQTVNVSGGEVTVSAWG